MKTEEQKAHFVMVFDEERAHFFNAMVGATNRDVLVLPAVKSRGLQEMADSFLREFSDKYHEKGWCKDPQCSYPKK